MDKFVYSGSVAVKGYATALPGGMYQVQVHEPPGGVLIGKFIKK